jgi:hypothetical protein
LAPNLGQSPERAVTPTVRTAQLKISGRIVELLGSNCGISCNGLTRGFDAPERLNRADNPSLRKERMGTGGTAVAGPLVFPTGRGE